MSGMKEIIIKGRVSRILDKYVITTVEGIEYELSAIMPWEAVSPDFGAGVYAIHLGKQMVASGVTDGHTIWKAFLTEV
ncbi:MAG: hypothetical protein E4H14_00560 [Candidatus Thorarchaeota archaeon]|nr:MAG: hypothetical protein E4H14_00560 [Candidatus Thorarchaeota archaeon]